MNPITDSIFLIIQRLHLSRTQRGNQYPEFLYLSFTWGLWFHLVYGCSVTLCLCHELLFTVEQVPPPRLTIAPPPPHPHPHPPPSVFQVERWSKILKNRGLNKGIGGGM